MNEPAYFQLFLALLPEALLVFTALLVLLADFALCRGIAPRARVRRLGWTAVLGCVAALTSILGLVMGEPLEVPLLHVTPLLGCLKAAVLALTLAVVLIAIDTDFTPFPAEYFALVLFATVGFLVLLSVTHLLLMFVALELASLCLYLLTAFDQRHPRAAEAGLKYFLFGSVAAAVLLFGLSLVFGLNGHLHFTRMDVGEMDALVAVALVLVLAGFAFKIAVVPFHLWAPDAYQGAPAPSAALVASGSKVASFYVLWRLLHEVFGGAAGNAAWGQLAAGWLPLLALLAALSMVLGNLAALVQRNVRRLLAYSAIAHSGYALLGVMVGDSAPLLYYVVTYALTLVGAFGVVALVEHARGGSDLDHFNGLARQSPVLAACLVVFMLSLAGIPPLAGFFGKFYVFLEVLRGSAPAKAHAPGMLYLVILGIAMSAVSLYYYLQVLKRAYAAEPPFWTPGDTGLTSKVVVFLLALAVLLCGCFPSWLMDFFS